jgi:hypothetical protein
LSVAVLRDAVRGAAERTWVPMPPSPPNSEKPRMPRTTNAVSPPKIPAIVPPALRRGGLRAGTYRYCGGGP